MPKSTKKNNKNTLKLRVKQREIYLDYAASNVPNPSSIHKKGVEAKVKLEKARQGVALILHTQRDNIIFTSGATESNNLAIQGMAFSYLEKEKGLPHIISTNIEHASVLETIKTLEKRKQAEVTIVEVGKDGIVDPKKIKKEIRRNTVLISVMYANNEIGTIEPIKEIVKEIRHYRKLNKTIFPFFHTDATQAIKYLNLNTEMLGVDLMSLSGAKIRGAGKIGVLFRKKYIPLSKIYSGGDQEFGLRPGTENLSEIQKFVSVFKNSEKNKGKEAKRLAKLQNYFIKKLPKVFTINGSEKQRLPNNINISHPKIPGDLLVVELSSYGVMASSRSACKSKDENGSYVIQAVNPNATKEVGGLRLSFGEDTKKKDLDYVVKILAKILTKLEKWYN